MCVWVTLTAPSQTIRWESDTRWELFDQGEIHPTCPPSYHPKTIICLKDYGSVAPTPIIMKCLKGWCWTPSRSPSLLTWTSTSLPIKLSPAPQHLENPNSHVMVPFVNLGKLADTLLSLGLDYHLCCWIKDFLSYRPQHVRLGPRISSSTILNIGTPQGCVLRPLIFSPFTHSVSPTVMRQPTGWRSRPSHPAVRTITRQHKQDKGALI